MFDILFRFRIIYPILKTRRLIYQLLTVARQVKQYVTNHKKKNVCCIYQKHKCTSKTDGCLQSKALKHFVENVLNIHINLIIMSEIVGVKPLFVNVYVYKLCCCTQLMEIVDFSKDENILFQNSNISLKTQFLRTVIQGPLSFYLLDYYSLVRYDKALHKIIDMARHTRLKLTMSLFCFVLYIYVFMFLLCLIIFKMNHKIQKAVR